MLVLSRSVGEGLWIGDDVYVTVVSRKGDTIRLGIGAPPDVGIIRGELNGSGKGGSGGDGMLVLARKTQQTIRIADNITITVVKVGGISRLGVDAPKDVRILRAELRNAA